MDLRRHRGGLVALEARDPIPRAPHLQPIELRARALLRGARQHAGRPARLLVGADVALDGPRPGPHRRGRPDDPLPNRTTGDCSLLLARVRGRHGRGGSERARDDRKLASRGDHGLDALARARVLAGGPGVPLLHDHGPEDDAGGQGSAPRLRGRRGAARGPPDGPTDDRVLDEGDAARVADDRLRRATRARRGARRRRSGRRSRLACRPRALPSAPWRSWRQPPLQAFSSPPASPPDRR